MEHGRFPWTPSPLLVRPDVQRWLVYNAHVPVRVICAPAGWGKKTAAIVYGRSHERRSVFVAVPPNAGIEAFVTAFSEAIDRHVGSLGELLSALEGRGIHEVILDDIDLADEALRAELSRLPRALGSTLRFVYLLRARTALDLLAPLTSGLATVLPTSLLPFGRREISALCEQHEVPCRDEDADRLARATDGWPFAVVSAIQDAAVERRPLEGVYVRWLSQHRRVLAELAERSLSQLDHGYRSAAERFYAGEPVDDVLFARFADAGLLVAPDETERRPLRPIVDALQHGAVLGTFFAAPASRNAEIEMFGTFSMRIAGQTVQWARRRDRQLVQYLALKPEGRASRDELIATFWPNAEPALAAQGLRTACSTVRRAIGACVGTHRVAQFFTAEKDVALVLERVTPTTRRFRVLVQSGEDALSRGDEHVAQMHLRAALQLYRAPLLAAEAGAPWIESEAAAYAAMAEKAAAALETLRPNDGIEGALMR